MHWWVGVWVGGGRGEMSVSLNLLRSSRLHLVVPKVTHPQVSAFGFVGYLFREDPIDD